jgi:hypothetical protein
MRGTEAAMSSTSTVPIQAGSDRLSKPIADYGLLADCNSAALVARDGSIDWLCLPRYDSGAIFARILDPDAGHWLIRPAGEYESERRYLPGSLAIETTFTTPSGSVRLVDAMAAAPGQRGHDLGFDAPHELLRSVEGVSGSVELVTEIAVRPEFGLVRPLVRLEDGGARTFGADPVAVASGVPLEVEESTMRAAFTVAAGERVGFSMRWSSGTARERPQATPAADVADRIVDTVGAPGRPSTTSTTARTGSSSVIRRVCSRGSPTARPARSWPPPRPRCPRPWAASATGTTASRGSATRA